MSSSKIDKRITSTFSFNEKQNFYEIRNLGPNSIMRLYDSHARLKMSRKMQIPQNHQIITCQHYLIFFNKDTISILDLTNIATKMVTGYNTAKIKEIVCCQYNQKANIFFITDPENNLYYLMHTTSNIQTKLLYSCKARGLQRNVDKLLTDLQANVYLYFKQQLKLEQLVFNYQSDMLKEQNSTNDSVYEVYYRNGWEIVIIGQNEQKMVLQNQRGSSALSQQSQQKYLKLHIKSPQQYFKTIHMQQLPFIIASTKNQLLLLDSQTKNIIFVYEKQIYLFGAKSSLFGDQLLQNIVNKKRKFLFAIKKIAYQKICVTIWVYDDMTSEFIEYKRIFNNTDESQTNNNEELILNAYIHSNIEHIFSDNPINVHYEPSIIKYIQLYEPNSCVKGKKLATIAIKLLKVLFQHSPQTLNKLVSWIIQTYNVGKLKEFSHKQIPIQDIGLYEITHKYAMSIREIIKEILKQALGSDGQDQIQNNNIATFLDFKKQKQDDRQIKSSIRNTNDEKIKMLKKNQKILRNIIKFLSIMTEAVDSQSLLEINAFSQAIFDRETLILGQRNHELLEHCKSIYLSFDIMSKLLFNEENQEIIKKLSQWIDRLNNRQKDMTISQIYNLIPKKLPFIIRLISKKFVRRQIKLKDIIGCMLQSRNFLHTAYLYICIKGIINSHHEQIEDWQIPYLNHQSYKQLLIYIHICDNSRSLTVTSKLAAPDLYKMTSLALTIGDQCFLKYMCCLSVCLNNRNRCYGIINSGIFLEWAKNGYMRVASSDNRRESISQNLTMEEYIAEIQFVLKYHVLSDRVLDGYNYLLQVKNKIWMPKKKNNGQQSRQYKGYQGLNYLNLLIKFIGYAIQQEKFKDFFKIQKDNEDYDIIFRQLKEHYGNEITEIENITRQLK